MKCPQTTFYAHTMSDSQVIRSKKTKFIIRSKFIIYQNLLCSTVFFSSCIFCWNYNRYWYAFASL